MKRSLVPSLVSALVVVFASGAMATNAWAQKPRASAHAEAVQLPLYSDYKGVRIGMTAEEVRGKLGKAAQKADDQDYYVISENEAVQIAYDASLKVKAISVDYLGGLGAPDYKAVVGADIDVRPDGSIHKLVMYDKLGFWVSYNRSAGNVPVVTVTIQKTMN